MEVLLAFGFGLLIGSFVNVCIYRLIRNRSVVSPRSYCPHCGRTIAWYDNLPVASYLLLRGRCRNCGRRISWLYPTVEALMGALFALAVARHGVGPVAAKLCLLAALLVALFFTDWKRRLLPDELTLGGTLLGLGFAWVVPLELSLSLLVVPWDTETRWASLVEAALAAALASGILWLIGEAYYRIRGREGLGFGDVKLVALLGAFLGMRGVLLALLAGSVSGTVIGLVWIAATRQRAATAKLPFGSFLSAAGLAVAWLLA